MARWKELSKFLLYKYLDGNVKDATGKVTHPGYDEAWYRMVAAATGDRLKTAKLPAELEAERASEGEGGQALPGGPRGLPGPGLEVGAATREKVLATDDPGKLESWLVNAATAPTPEVAID